MTHLQNKPSEGPVFSGEILRKARLTSLGLWVEQAWPALWPSLGWLGLFLVLSLFDVWQQVPLWAHGLSLVVILASIIRPLWRHRTAFNTLPDQHAALRRLELDNNLEHRPLSERDDDLKLGVREDEAEHLWALHKDRLRRDLPRLRNIRLRSSLPAKDPLALRALLGLLLFVGVLNAGPEWNARLAAGVNPGFGPAAAGGTRFDAWITPPQYTNLPPIFLTRREIQEQAKPITIPTGSLFVARIGNTRSTPRLTVLPESTSDKQVVEGDNIDGHDFDLQFEVTENAEIKLSSGRRTMETWVLHTQNDRPPIIAFVEPPKTTEHKTVELNYAIRDDFGIAQAEAVITLRAEEEAPASQTTNQTDSETMRVSLSLSSSDPATINGTSFHDLTAHPWAGLSVDMSLEALDELDQKGFSQTQIFILPERVFINPLARAIVEQRRNLARDVTNWSFVSKALDAITHIPEDYFEDAVIYLGLRDVYWFLTIRQPETMAEVTFAIDLLWQLALRAEEGDLSIAARELREIQQALLDALAAKAPLSEIQALLEKYKQALDRYLQAMMEAAQDAIAHGEDVLPPDMGSETLSRSDLSDILDAIEGLSQTGDQDAARQLLTQLQRMLENMQMTGGSGGQSPGDKAMGEALDELGDMIGRERSLMDETFRKDQEKGAGPTPETDLADRQREIGEALKAMREKLESEEIEMPTPLERAQESMKDAEGDLGKGDTGRAMDAEENAINQLREGAMSLAEQLMESLSGQQQGGAHGQSRTDPLGRASGGTATGFGDDVKVPTQQEIQKAKEILEELRRRASESDRPDLELDYLDRLLKRF